MNRGKVANSIILTETESQIEDTRVNEYGEAWEMFSVHPVNVSASLQLPYEELPENANRIPASSSLLSAGTF